MSVNRRFRLILGIRKIHYSQKYVVQHTKKFAGIKKKVVPLHHEKVIKDSNILSDCMVTSGNYHIINLLHSGKFAGVNLTHSKLAKSLHLKIGAKVVKIISINKLNQKFMKTISQKAQKEVLQTIKQLEKGDRIEFDGYTLFVYNTSNCMINYINCYEN